MLHTYVDIATYAIYLYMYLYIYILYNGHDLYICHICQICHICVREGVRQRPDHGRPVEQGLRPHAVPGARQRPGPLHALGPAGPLFGGQARQALRAGLELQEEALIRWMTSTPRRRFQASTPFERSGRRRAQAPSLVRALSKTRAKVGRFAPKWLGGAGLGGSEWLDFT